MNTFQKTSDGSRDPFAKEDVIDPIRTDGSDGLNRQIIDAPHEQGEDRQRQPAVGDDTVNPVAERGCASSLLLNALPAQIGDVIVAVVGDNAFAVVIELSFHGTDNTQKLLLLAEFNLRIQRLSVLLKTRLKTTQLFGITFPLEKVSI